MALRSAKQIFAEIEATFGFIPPFFEPAAVSPAVLENLWQQTRSAYIENPIPTLFKEKLAAVLARYCTVPYCLLCHSSALRPLGMTSTDVLSLLQEPPLGYAELAAKTHILNSKKLVAWPSAGSETELGILYCCIAIFLGQDTELCQEKLRGLLPQDLYEHLNMFLAYNRTCLSWAEAHPELNYENDKRVQDHYASLVSGSQELGNFFKNYQGKVREQTERRTQWLTEENKVLVRDLKENQEWLAATLHGIGDAVIATDASAPPKVTFLNAVAEELTGWPMALAKGKSVDIVFNIINEHTRAPALNPIGKVISTGKIQGLANHTVLISASGLEYVIEDSASPIRNHRGEIQGVVLIFRDVTEQKRLERESEKMNRSEKQARRDLEDFFMQAPLPLVILDGPQHEFKLANPPYEQLIGRKASGKQLFEVFTPEEIKIYTPMLDAVYETGTPYIGKEMPLPLANDEGVIQDHWIDIGYYPSRGPDGSVKGILAIVQDVTDSRNTKKALEDSESNFRAFADSTPTMVFTTKPNGDLDYINPRWYEYSGLTPEQTLGSAYASTIHPADVVNTMEKWKLAVDNQVRFDIEHRFKGADGMFRWFSVSIEPKFEDGKVVRWYGTMSDVHDQRMFAQQLAQARDSAEKANETKSSFLANMSHEIRTPLGAIIGFTEMLRDDSVDRAERRNFIEVINRNAKSLTRVIDDILDLSKVEAGRLDIELSSVSLREITKDVLDLFSDRAKAIGITLSLQISDEVPAKVLTDPVRIRQILINIVGNAVKFTEKGSVAVSVECDDSGVSEKAFKILVKDTGRGLTKIQQAKLFQAFSQADNTTTREFGGTGLGLVLSRRLANALGGNVDIEHCHEGKGCTFAISFRAKIDAGLPAVQALPSKNLQTSKSPAPLKDMRILLVEDSPDNQMLIQRVLARNGATVVLADNGSQGVNRALESDFDVVLMDIQMPIMDGYAAIAKLRAGEYSRPVIALTAHAMEDERKRTLAAGFSEHVTKPIEFPVLIEAILAASAGTRGTDKQL